MRKINYNGTDIYINKLIPFKGYLAMMLFGFIFYRKEYEYYLNSDEYYLYVMNMINHESIHKEQIKDFGLPFFFFKPLQILVGSLFFYPLYFFEWIIKIFIYGPKKAYRNISFEREAFANEKNYLYINKRKHFAQYRKNTK